MVYDDLIVGSGLTALAVAYGLPVGRRVCVLTGPEGHDFKLYGEASGIPCANNGCGGLGSFWHGVIPMGQPQAFYEVDSTVVAELFHHFYTESIEDRLGKPWLFVPYRPIRPIPHWKILFNGHPGWQRVAAHADRIDRNAGLWAATVGQETYSAPRIWMAAGALGTPALLERSPGFLGCSRTHISDHVILYLGQLNRQVHPHVPYPIVERSSSGVWLLGAHDTSGTGLLTTKPARFSYARLDCGIEQRAAFGLPTSDLLGKLLKAPSLGLISESLFNKLGLFPRAELLSAYAQICIKDAYRQDLSSVEITPNTENIQSGIHLFRNKLDWPELQPSRRPELYIHGIHLHHSLDMNKLKKSGALDEGLTIADSSCIADIGPEHHSFKAMVRAYSIAKSS